jgi:hypothetical protein
MLLSSVKRVTHGFYYFVTLRELLLAVSINGKCACLAISINGKYWLKSNIPALPVSEHFLVFILYQMLIQTFETLAQ